MQVSPEISLSVIALSFFSLNVYISSAMVVCYHMSFGWSTSCYPCEGVEGKGKDCMINKDRHVVRIAKNVSAAVDEFRRKCILIEQRPETEGQAKLSSMPIGRSRSREDLSRSAGRGSAKRQTSTNRAKLLKESAEMKSSEFKEYMCWALSCGLSGPRLSEIWRAVMKGGLSQKDRGWWKISTVLKERNVSKLQHAVLVCCEEAYVLAAAEAGVKAVGGEYAEEEVRDKIREEAGTKMRQLLETENLTHEDLQWEKFWKSMSRVKSAESKLRQC